MVGYPVPLEANLNHVVQECAQPPQRACPATPIKSVDPENETVELQVEYFLLLTQLRDILVLAMN